MLVSIRLSLSINIAYNNCTIGTEVCVLFSRGLDDIARSRLDTLCVLMFWGLLSSGRDRVDFWLRFYYCSISAPERRQSAIVCLRGAVIYTVNDDFYDFYFFVFFRLFRISTARRTYVTRVRGKIITRSQLYLPFHEIVVVKIAHGDGVFVLYICYFRTSHEKSLMRWVYKLKKKKTKTKYLKTRNPRYYKSAEFVRMPASKFYLTRFTRSLVLNDACDIKTNNQIRKWSTILNERKE